MCRFQTLCGDIYRTGWVHNCMHVKSLQTLTYQGQTECTLIMIVLPQGLPDRSGLLHHDWKVRNVFKDLQLTWWGKLSNQVVQVKSNDLCVVKTPSKEVLTVQINISTNGHKLMSKLHQQGENKISCFYFPSSCRGENGLCTLQTKWHLLVNQREYQRKQSSRKLDGIWRDKI